MSYQERGHRRNNRYNGNRNNDNKRGRYDNDRSKVKEEPILTEEQSLKARLSMLILKIGDKASSTFQKNLEILSKVLVKDYESYSDAILNFLQTCILELPSKTSIYGCLIGFTLKRNEEVGKAIIEHFRNELQNRLNIGDWVNVKILLRFFGELVNGEAVTPDSFLNIYDLLSAKIENKIEKNIGDCMVNLILGSLPWVGETLYNTKPEELTKIMDKVEIYMLTRSQQEDPSSNILKVFQDSNPDQHEFLELLWKQINNLKQRNWKVEELLRFKSTVESQVLPITIAELSLPTEFNKFSYDYPNYVFTLFPEHEDWISEIGYYIITDTMSDSIDIFHTNRRECVRLLVNFRENFTSTTFAPLTSDKTKIKDELKDEDNGDDQDNRFNGQINLMNLIIEVYFKKIFTLPAPKHKFIYYSALIIETFKAEQVDFKAAFNIGLKNLIDKANDMDIECIDRFYNWFSHYLSNFEYNFEWEEFSNINELNPFDYKRMLISESLAKIIRLSYYDRIKATLPESLHELIPQKAPEPNFSFRKVPDDAPHKRFCTLIVEAFRTKKSIDFFNALINDARDQLLDETLIKQIVVETILIMGSKSFTHMMNVTERNLKLYQEIAREESDKQQTVSIVGNFWKENPQWLSIQLNRLLSYHIIEHITVIKWIFEIENYDNYNRCYLWEILYTTLNTVRLWRDQQKEKYDQSINNTSNDDNESSETLLAQYNNAQNDYKMVLFEILQSFVTVLTNLRSKLSGDGQVPEENELYNLIVGRFKEFGRKCRSDIKEFNVTIETIIFTPSVDQEIRDIFKMFQGLNNSIFIDVISSSIE
ncbi:ARM repeat-containing protein [Neoconidiobolus thromboides FSU 785]|nr:ARM repeat-containing protein [Neoconidiobolus thromboides FSU 785]